MDISLSGRGVSLSRALTPAAIQELPAPATVRLPLRQASGALCIPVVEKGDEVKRGQLVAEGPAPLHSPIAGSVTGIEAIPSADGGEISVLVIAADDGGKTVRFETDGIPLKREPEQLLERIRAAGIVQAGRESQPLASMLEEARAPRGHLAATGAAVMRPVRHLVIRCLDVDPFMVNLAAVTASLGKDSSELDLAMQILLLLTQAEQVHFVMGAGQDAEAIVGLAAERDWQVLRVPCDVYPALADPLVAAAVSGHEPDVAWRRVDQSGTLVLDIDVVLQVVAAVRDGKPVLDRVITVWRAGRAKALRAALGTSFDVLAREAGHDGVYGKVILGGPMQGLAYHTLDFPLAKHLTGLTLQGPDEVVHDENHPCISCGLCGMVCPMRLVPGMLSRFCEYGQWEDAENAHLFTCIECGCCAYVCPAGRSMVQFMVQGKNELLARRTA
jgi:electron transport complex protein RnfC